MPVDMSLDPAQLPAAVHLGFEAQTNMTNNFPSFLDTSPGTGNSSSGPRLAPSPITQQQQQQQQQQQINNNGNGAGMNGIPIAAGQQADVNFLFQKVVELSEVLKENREKTAGIIAGAEELAVSIPTWVSDALSISFNLCYSHTMTIANPISLI